MKVRSDSVVLDEDRLYALVDLYSEFDAFAFDVETRGPHRGDPRRGDVFWLSLAGPGRADVIPMGHPLGRVIGHEYKRYRKDGLPYKNDKPYPLFGTPPAQLDAETVFSALKPLFFSDAEKCGHNLKFDLQATAQIYGETPPGPYFDTMIAAFLLNESFRGSYPYSLGSCVFREFKFEYDKSLGRIGVDTFPLDEAGTYSRYDGKYAWLLRQEYKPRIQQEGFSELFQLEMDVLRAVIWMEQAGVRINRAGLAALEQRLAQDLDRLQTKIRAAAGWEINLNANRQVAKLVFEQRKHEVTMETETGEIAVSDEALSPYASDPIVADIMEWRDLNKMHGTYASPMLAMLYDDDRLHGDFDQRGARTGRFSCRKPNLQNVPARRSKDIRQLFIPAPGHVMIVADYNQIELRLLAHFTRDPLLVKAYQEGQDLHAMTAMAAYRTKTPTPLQRSLAKNCNFSMAYGATAWTLVTRYEVPTEREAQKLIDAFYGTYKLVRPWQERTVAEARERRILLSEAKAMGCRRRDPYVETLLGRHRRLPELFNPDPKKVRAAERQCVNTRIQGSAGDILKLAMVRLYHRLVETPAQLLLTVHDELVVEAPEDEAEDIATLVRDAMENVVLPEPLLVPLVASVSTVANWSEK